MQTRSLKITEVGRRTSLPLAGTAAQRYAKLDSTSVLAADYAAEWLARQGSPTVPFSGVIRRALQVYLQHLKRTEDGPSEARAVARACKASSRPGEEHQAALARLAAVQKGQPLPAFEVIDLGPQAAAQRAQLLERIAAHSRALEGASTETTTA